MNLFTVDLFSISLGLYNFRSPKVCSVHRERLFFFDILTAHPTSSPGLSRPAILKAVMALGTMVVGQIIDECVSHIGRLLTLFLLGAR